MSFLTARGDWRHVPRHAPYGEMECEAEERETAVLHGKFGIRSYCNATVLTGDCGKRNTNEEEESPDVSVMESVLGNPDLMMV